MASSTPMEVDSPLVAVEDRVEKEQDPDEKKYLRKEKEQLWKEEEQLWEDKKQLLEKEILLFKSTVASGIGGAPGNIDVASVLMKEFGAKLRDARRVEWESNPLRDSCQFLLNHGYLVSDQDPGVYFSISAREDTLSSLLRGAAQAYLNCTRENNLITSRDTGIREPHFNAVIAYPGAGKTTIGTDYPLLLRRFWSEKGQRVLLDSLLPHGFSKMIEDSWEYRCSQEKRHENLPVMQYVKPLPDENKNVVKSDVVEEAFGKELQKIFVAQIRYRLRYSSK